MSGRRRRRRALVERLRRDESGQMTVELLAVLPVLLVVALVAVNALTFFSECAAFDRIGRNAVRLCATSPAYEQSLDDAVGQVKALLEEQMSAENLECEVSVERDLLGHAMFTLKLAYYPTLFGMGMRDQVLGVPLPALEHCKTLAVDTYKPGMLL